jgi:ADP-dependent NAD(P)H-hydrate dehydratase / NAD(P)H-hydrate epimerase
MLRVAGGNRRCVHWTSKTHNAAMHKISRHQPCPLFDVAATLALEQAAGLSLAPQTLMQRAGLAVAKLTLALAPHARTIWVVCGPGNNYGDGLEAALNLRHSGKQVVVTWLGHQASMPPDAQAALLRIRSTGVAFTDAPPERWDCRQRGRVDRPDWRGTCRRHDAI